MEKKGNTFVIEKAFNLLDNITIECNIYSVNGTLMKEVFFIRDFKDFLYEIPFNILSSPELLKLEIIKEIYDKGKNIHLYKENSTIRSYVVVYNITYECNNFRIINFKLRF